MLVELVDELADGAREAAWPFLRAELGFDYFQIGVLIGLPALLSGVLEPVLGVLADTRLRRMLVLSGGVLFVISLFLTAASPGFWVLLLSFVLFYPASGAFVNISQAELMDRYPDRRDQNMARWTFAGSAGSLVGPLALGAASAIGLSWRGLYAGIGAASVALLIFVWRSAFPASSQPAGAPAKPSPGFIAALRVAWSAVRAWPVLRWLALLELADLMLDVLLGFLALYLVETGGLTPAQAALGVSLFMAAQLVGDLLVIPLLEKVDGLRAVRATAALCLVAYPAFLLANPLAVKLALICAVGLLRAGWYAVLQARLYAALPGRSGVAVAVGTIAQSAAALIPIALGALAEAAGLRAAMWALLAAPVGLVLCVPRERRTPGRAAPSR